jgi:tetratricopeptide (TPR) repeat protein
MLGVILEAQGDKEKAKAHYEKALAAKPKHWFFTPAFYKSRLKH